MKDSHFWRVPFRYLLFLIFNEPEYDAGIDPGMTLTPLLYLVYRMRRDPNLQPFKRKSRP
jgi:hypothetical protein